MPEIVLPNEEKYQDGSKELAESVTTFSKMQDRPQHVEWHTGVMMATTAVSSKRRAAARVRGVAPCQMVRHPTRKMVSAKRSSALCALETSRWGVGTPSGTVDARFGERLRGTVESALERHGSTALWGIDGLICHVG